MAGQSPKNTRAKSDAFIKAAHELECDDSEDRSNTVLRQVAKHKPKPDAAKVEKAKPGRS